MSSFYVDAHCHLDLMKGIDKNPSSEDDLPIKSISVTNAPFLFEPNHKLFENSKNIRVALGLHPELISQYSSQIDVFRDSISATRYIGEIGLDGSSQHKSNFQLQKKIFEEILVIASNAGSKILTIHSRNAASATIELLQKNLKNSNCKVIMHWYSGDLTSLKKAVAYGYFFSVNHKMISSSKGNQIIESIPSSHILTETDAPFTFDTKITNRLASLEKAVSGIAQLIKKAEGETKEMIFENFRSLLN